MRAKPIDSPPPAPYDIFLKRHECPVYRERRQANLSISKNPEENFSLKRIWFETLMLFYHICLSIYLVLRFAPLRQEKIT